MHELVGKKIKLKNGNGLGDTVVATCSIRDFKNTFECETCLGIFVSMRDAPNCPSCKRRIDDENRKRAKSNQLVYEKKTHRCNEEIQIKVETNFMPIWDNNPHLDEFPVEDMTLGWGPGTGTQTSNSSGLHACSSYRTSLLERLARFGVKIAQGVSIPEIYLSKEEVNMEAEIDRRYWLITTGGKTDYDSKLWHYDRWQEVVNARPDITFVQIGSLGDYHPVLEGANVINMLGATESAEDYTPDINDGMRRLFRLFYHCDGSLGIVSAQMHIAAAFEKPCVVVAGAREPASFEAYPYHRYLHNQGAMLCPKAGKETVGCTSPIKSCWRRKINACPNKRVMKTAYGDQRVAKCIEMISVSDVLRAMQTYYDGGRLQPLHEPRRDAKTRLKMMRDAAQQDGVEKYDKDAEAANQMLRLAPVEEPVKIETLKGIKVSGETGDGAAFEQVVAEGRADEAVQARMNADTIEKLPPEQLRMSDRETAIDRDNRDAERTFKNAPSGKIARMLCNGHSYGGGERSTIWLMRNLMAAGLRVEYAPPKHISPEYAAAIPEIMADGLLTKMDEIVAPCDILLIYCNDLSWKFNEALWCNMMGKMEAKSRIMVVNYKMGQVGKVEWTKNFDGYIFLSSTMRDSFLVHCPEARDRCYVLAPPVELKPFLDIDTGSLNRTLHLVRHSSQGDNKYGMDINEMLRQIKAVDSKMKISLMPPPSFLDYTIPGVDTYRVNQIPVTELLRAGTCFFNPLPYKYTDQGPRTIVEAMAVGLPVIADNRDGARDRVTPETGWLPNTHEEYAEVLAGTTGKEIARKGAAAKERARKEFDPVKWIETILNIID